MPDLNNLFQAASTVGGSESDQLWLVIDHDFRTIDIPANKKLLGVTSDERINYLDFKGPQFYEGSDLSTFSLRVVYLNSRGESDIYVVPEVNVDDGELQFTWEVGRHACLYSGDVRFIVQAVLTDTEGYILKKYNTRIHSLPVVEGIEPDEGILLANYDLITQFAKNIQKSYKIDEYIADAEAYALGTRGGVAVEEDDPTYENNAKYYSEKMEPIMEASEMSEAWAVGTKNGEPVAADDVTYHNNAKYYSNVALNELGTKVNALYSEASGDPVEYHDGAEGLSLRSAKIALEPIQDLHGFDHPWPAGTQKNKLPVTLTDRTTSGLTVTVNDISQIVVNGLSDSICYLPVNNNLDTTALAGYVFRVNEISGISWRISSAGSTDAVQELTNGTAIEDNGSGMVLYCRISNGLILENATLSVMLLRADETDLNYSPYRHVCNILGRSSIVVYHSDDISDEAAAPEEITADFERLAPIYGADVDISKGTALIDHVKVSVPKSDFGDVVASLLGRNYRVAELTDAVAPADVESQICNCGVIADPDDRFNTEDYVAIVYFAEGMEHPELRVSDQLYQLLSDTDSVDICYAVSDKIYGEFAQVYLESYKGTNYFWMDDGELDVEYPVDLITHIDATAAKNAMGVVVELEGSNITLDAQFNTRYKCGTLTSLTVTSLPEDGDFDIIFYSGTPQTDVHFPETVKLPSWFTAGTYANMYVEINVLDGQFGSVQLWA